MVRKVTEIDPKSPSEALWIYNALDACVTREVFDKIHGQLGNNPVYEFELALQAPAMEMMLRGLRVDLAERAHLITVLRGRLDRLTWILNQYGQAIFDSDLNANSPKQLQHLFYTVMKLPKVWSFKKGERKLSTDREALEKLAAYYYAAPIVSVILAIRDNSKLIQTLSKAIDADGRIRTSYNIGGTETGRWSSSTNAFGTGDNLQNWNDEVRRIIIADDGWKLAYIDLQTAESVAVGYLSGDEEYIKACESGDVHTYVATLTWPEVPWTGDLKHDKELAEQPYYRHFSRRFMCKRGGHGCLTSDHEVFTRHGWVPITDKPAEILTFTQEGSFFDSVSHWTDFDYTGDLHTFTGNSTSLRMTSDHRIPYRSDNRSKIRTRTAVEGPGRFMPLGFGYVGGNVTCPARLIAAFMSDGHQKSSNCMEFHLHKQRKVDRLQYLCQLYGFEFSARSNGKYIVRGALAKRAGPFMLDWKPELLDDFLDEYKRWDGHESATAVSLTSIDRAHLEWIQTLGRIRGIGGALSGPYTSGFGSSVYRLQQNNRRWASGNCIIHAVESVADLRVLCPTVNSTWFYVRHNGKITVTGNSNYYGKPPTIARHMKAPIDAVAEFQARYFARFSGIPRWHNSIAQTLQTEGALTTPFGRRRVFLGRSWDDATLREAIAYGPQSLVADILNQGLLQLWREWNSGRLEVCPLAQVHDAVLVTYREEREAELLPQAIRAMSYTIEVNGRPMTIPYDAEVGWNWSKYTKDNPNGLKKWRGHDDRTRIPTPGVLDRVLP